jgi:hypothetical protein
MGPIIADPGTPVARIKADVFVAFPMNSNITPTPATNVRQTNPREKEREHSIKTPVISSYEPDETNWVNPNGSSGEGILPTTSTLACVAVLPLAYNELRFGNRKAMYIP